MWILVAGCLLIPLAAGCQTTDSCHSYSGGHHPPFQKLEQGCFGYEPTVWRNMGEDCQQAVRMIPDEPLVLPVVKSATTQVPKSDTPSADTEEEVLGNPEPKSEDTADVDPLGLPGIMKLQGDESEDGAASDTPQEVPLSDLPTVPQDPPANQPIDQVPSSVVPPAEPAPAIPSKPEEPPAEKQSRFSPPRTIEPSIGVTPTPPQKPEPRKPEPRKPESQFPPVIDGPMAKASAAKASADSLFKTVSQALEAPPAKPVAKKNVPAAGLSKFISY